MSMSNAAETAFLNLLFKNVAWDDVGDAAGLQPSAAAGSLYVRLHTADPGDTGTGDTNEANYTGYVPVAVTRGAGWTVVSNQVSNTAAVQFGECTGGTNVLTHFSVCSGSGAGAEILFSGTLSAARSISSGITPLFNAGQLQGTVD